MPLEIGMEFDLKGNVFEGIAAEVFFREALPLMDESVELIAESVAKRVPVDTGSGARSVASDAFPVERAVVGQVTTSQQHVLIHDRGARFQRMPKNDDGRFDLWAKRQGVVGPLEQRSRRRGKPGPKPKLKGNARKQYEIRRATFAIRRKIKERGLPAQHFFAKGLAEVEGQVRDNLQRKLPERYAEGLS
jgi:hypothetical protein